MAGFYCMVCYDCRKAYNGGHEYCPYCGAKLCRWDLSGGNVVVEQEKEKNAAGGGDVSTKIEKGQNLRYAAAPAGGEKE